MPNVAPCLLAFAQRFLSRRDDYALQQITDRYRRVGAPVSAAVLRRHLAGVETMGTYVIDEAGSCRFAVYDADTPDGLSRLAGVQARLAADGIPSHLEGSRRGGHLWVLPYCPPGVEFYPKQAAARQGYGSLIRVPLGVHRKSGRRYPFVSWVAGAPVLVAHSTSALLSWCCALERAAIPDAVLDPVPSPAPPQPSITKKVAAAPTSGYASIATWCAAQDPFSLIGRYVHLDPRGLGHCPFGEHHSDGVDQHPSLSC